MVRTLDDAGEIDAGDHGKTAHDGRLAGDGEGVFVVERGVRHIDRDIALGQLRLVDLPQGGVGALALLLDQDAFEHRCSLMLSACSRPVKIRR